MAVRKIVQIDEELCDGCGECVPSCAEGAIQVIAGKARLVKDQYCDGLGACLGECPQGAITVVEREAEDFDEAAVNQHLARVGRVGHDQPAHDRAAAPAPRHSGHERVALQQPAHAGHAGGGCPGSAMRAFAPRPAAERPTAGAPSALRQWPVQLHLVSPMAPYFQGADLLLAADCAAFSCGDFHARFLEGHALAIACPKLDSPEGYVEKLAAMISHAGIRSITVLMMMVPCCRGLEMLAAQAMNLAGRQVPLRRVILSLEGEVLSE